MLQINHEDTYAGTKLMPEGDYEVIVKSAYENATKAGTMYIQITLIVRNDVDQKYKNKNIFHAVWRTKETQEYNLRALNTIAKALGIPNGTKFNSLEEMLDSLSGKTAKITIKHEEWKGEVQEKVSFWNPTSVPECKHVLPIKNTAPAEAEFADADDLPF